MNIHKFILILLGSFLFSKESVGADWSPSWHGYAAQGLTMSDGSDFITDNDTVTGELTEIGINGSAQITSTLRLSGQLVYLDGGNRYKQGSRLDYLFLDWNLPDIYQWNLHLHLGRYKNRHWLSSATRDVPHTRDSIILPQSVYYDGLRDVALGSDGLALQALRANHSGNWEINWSVGRSSIDKSETEKFVGSMAKGRVKQDFVHQGSVFWQPVSMKWQFGASFLRSDFHYDSVDDDTITSGDSSVERMMLSMRYFSQNWEFSSELLQERLQYKGVFTTGYELNSDKTGQGGYVQWRYFLPDEITLLFRYDTYDLDRNDRSGTTLMRDSGGQIPAYYGFMDTGTLGLSWDIAPQWRLRGEVSRVHGAGRLKPVLLPDSLVRAEEYWNMYSLQLMYWF
jgi:hypothetical protein